MSKQTSQDLEKWAQKATQRLKDKLVIKHREMLVPSLDATIKIRNLSYDEVVEVGDMVKEDDPNYGDKYAGYIGIVEPDMKSLATKLKEDGQILEYTDVMNMFDMHELNSIVREIMILSGVSPDGKNKVTVVEELKN